MSLQLPEPDPAQAQGGPLPAGLGGGGYDQDNTDPLSVLQECIESLPGVLAALHDPQDVQDATSALLTLTKIQTRLMKQQGPGAPPQGQ